MASFNQVVVAGTLGSNVVLRYTPSGTAVCDLNLAVTRKWFDKQSQQKRDETTWVTVTLWGRTAEIAAQYLSKGKSVLIGGRLQESVWADKKTGEKRRMLKVVGETLQLLGSRGAEDQRPPNDNYGEESQVESPRFPSDPPAKEIPF